MGILNLIILILTGTALFVWSVSTKSDRTRERAIIRLSLLGLLVTGLATGLLDGAFRYGLLLLVLVVQGIGGIRMLAGKKEKPYRLRASLTRFVATLLLMPLVLMPAILFPQYRLPVASGHYEVATSRYTWTDETRPDTYSQTGGNRKLTVECWYPASSGETFPLIVFSHGAFGFSGSNHSTFTELASNGYVVASIGHTHQAFFTRDTDGILTTVDPVFLEQATALNATHDPARVQETFETTAGWMALRTADVAFVLDTIRSACENKEAGPLFSAINPDKIGLMGHSLGGATAAQMGRERGDIGAVIVLDGTMLGETLAVGNNLPILNDTPYPVPLLNLYAQDHYRDAKQTEGEAYANFHATRLAANARETVFQDAGHLNFTDLPLFSPLLAKQLGTGTIDPRFCIETMNGVVRAFFDEHLKGAAPADIAAEYAAP